MENEDINNEIVSTISNTERNSIYKSYMATKNILHLLNNYTMDQIHKIKFYKWNYGLYFPGRCMQRNSQSQWDQRMFSSLFYLNSIKEKSYNVWYFMATIIAISSGTNRNIKRGTSLDNKCTPLTQSRYTQWSEGKKRKICVVTGRWTEGRKRRKWEASSNCGNGGVLHTTCMLS